MIFTDLRQRNHKITGLNFKDKVKEGTDYNTGKVLGARKRFNNQSYSFRLSTPASQKNQNLHVWKNYALFQLVE